MSASSTDLGDYIIVITGANTGIGLASARSLASRGAHLVLACRSADKTEPVIARLKAETGNPEIDFLSLDLASLADVRRAAAELLARDFPIHVLVNNAGLAGERGATRDGFELAFGVNHLGHFLLTQLLLDRLRASAPARIVNVASSVHYKARRFDLSAVRRPTSSMTGIPEYQVSKLANVLFTAELARRLQGSGVTSCAVHPGVIASNIWRHLPWPIRFMAMRFMLPPEEGARGIVRCATDPALTNISGEYYHEDGQPQRPSRLAEDHTMAAELWAASEVFLQNPLACYLRN